MASSILDDEKNDALMKTTFSDRIKKKKKPSLLKQLQEDDTLGKLLEKSKSPYQTLGTIAGGLLGKTLLRKKNKS